MKKKGRTEGRWLEEEDEKKYRHFLIPTFVCSDSQSKQIDYHKFCHWGQKFDFLLIQTVPIWVFSIQSKSQNYILLILMASSTTVIWHMFLHDFNFCLHWSCLPRIRNIFPGKMMNSWSFFRSIEISIVKDPRKNKTDTQIRFYDNS